jgi:hypothetical protein
MDVNKESEGADQFIFVRYLLRSHIFIFSFSRSSKGVSGETVCWEGGQLIGRQTYPLKPINDLIEFARHMPLNNLMNWN